ncbi:MAG TPA: FIST N-terminal domain-containing protein [Verrucomicrobiae bacterium]|jgi:small ligand-binding sensory domain FIST|nr:FIST N-terminal domain-containing protein [Verrucomicrobiae bacterium]
MMRMIFAASSYSKDRNAENAAEVCGRQAMARLGRPKADVALVFATLHHLRSFEVLLEKIRKVTGAAHITGSSASGILTEMAELDNGPGVSVLLLSSDDLAWDSFLVRHLQESNLRAGLRLGERIKNEFPDPSGLFMTADHFSFHSPIFFEGLESTCGYVPVLGGTASEDGKQEKTYQFHGTEVSYDAFGGFAFSGPARTETALTQSCLPFGEPLRITRSRGHMIYELEGRPAYDIFIEHVSQIESEDPQKAHDDVMVGLPMRSFQTDFSKSNYVVHNITEVNTKSGVIACTAPVEEGEFLTFAVRDAAYARADMENTLRDLKTRLDGRKPAFGLYYNCASRGKNLYGFPDQDVNLIRAAFPDLPVAGFFSYAELAPVDYINHLHHYSGILTVVAP